MNTRILRHITAVCAGFRSLIPAPEVEPEVVSVREERFYWDPIGGVYLPSFWEGPSDDLTTIEESGGGDEVQAGVSRSADTKVATQGVDQASGGVGQ